MRLRSLLVLIASLALFGCAGAEEAPKEKPQKPAVRVAPKAISEQSDTIGALTRIFLTADKDIEAIEETKNLCGIETPQTSSETALAVAAEPAPEDPVLISCVIETPKEIVLFTSEKVKESTVSHGCRAFDKKTYSEQDSQACRGEPYPFIKNLPKCFNTPMLFGICTLDTSGLMIIHKAASAGTVSYSCAFIRAGQKPILNEQSLPNFKTCESFTKQAAPDSQS